MKYSRTILIIIVITKLYSAIKIEREFPFKTPKALDLSDHFGTEPVQNIYGPKPDTIQRLAREGVTSEATPITPINNFHQEISPPDVVSGDLLNTAYDASKIIKAPIAGITILI